ncbi:MAG: DUF72 domain-containing protein [Candidatus Eremiobacteraeota bacterium]|nr:DUF72 domain-containing protein [Candidatus Eremiobacteraeota bacterium]
MRVRFCPQAAPTFGDNGDTMSARIRLGAMGWQEKDWIGPFYPRDTTPKAMLAQYARSLPTVEVDSSFYGRPRQTTVDEWAGAVPDDFRFALKVPREVTHRRRFEDAGEVFKLFVDRVRTLGVKLGPILLQCPPDFKPNASNRSRLFEFLEMQLPDDVCVALELRDAQWFDDALFALAREHRFAIVAAESERFDVASAADVVKRQLGNVDFLYVRWMGPEPFEHYDRVQVDRSAALAQWTTIIAQARSDVSEIFGYVSDDYAGHAPGTVRELLGRLGENAPPDITTPSLF